MPEHRLHVKTYDLPDSAKREIARSLEKNIQDPSWAGPSLELEAVAAGTASEYRVTVEAGLAGLRIRRTGEGPDPAAAAAEAARSFKEILSRHGEYIRSLSGRTPVMELNILTRTFTAEGEKPPDRHFVKKLSLQEARVELELSDEPGMIFFNKDAGRPSVLLNYKDGTFALLEPGHDATGGAGIETMLTDSKPDSAPASVAKAAPVPLPKPDARKGEKFERLRPHLRCPSCRGEVEDREDGLLCSGCGRSFPLIAGVPVMTRDPDLDPEPRSDPVSKNPYGQQTLQVIDKYPKGLILDCGSGSPPVCFSNVIHLEIVRYPGVDIVAQGERLPFADETFDAVISEAVLEHVQDPFEYVKELWRVLKPGGEIRTDAAFLQPYHAYPHHYFNMTLSGLELLMKDFVKIDSGCGPHQQPYIMLGLVLEGFLNGIPDSDKRERVRGMTIGEVLHVIEEKGEKDPLQNLTKEAVSKLAAGFYFFGYKPTS